MLCSFLLTHARTITQEAQKKRVQQLEAALRDRDKLLALLKGKMMKDEAADSEEDDEEEDDEGVEVGEVREGKGEGGGEGDGGYSSANSSVGGLEEGEGEEGAEGDEELVLLRRG